MVKHELLFHLFFSFVSTLLLSVQIANATTFGDVIRQHRDLISNFNPNDLPPDYGISGFAFFDKIALVKESDERIEQLIQNNVEPDQIKVTREDRRNTLENIEYVKRKELINGNKSFTISITKYDVDKGNDGELFFIKSDSEDKYRRFSNNDFAKCRVELNELETLFGKPSVIRNLEDPSSKIPTYFTSSNSLDAQWNVENKIYSYNCNTFVSSQFFTDEVNTAYDNEKFSVRDIQSALNFFGFDAGSPDGKIGNKTKKSIAKFQDCVGAWQNGKLDSKQSKFLLNTYQEAAQIRTSSSCETLQADVPRLLVVSFATLKISNEKRSKTIYPIVWLNCLETSQRQQIFKFDMDESRDINSLLTLGVDLNAGTIYSGETKNTVARNANISDGVISWRVVKDITNKDFDKYELQHTLDRITGKSVQIVNLYQSNKLAATTTTLAECAKVALEAQKF